MGPYPNMKDSDVRWLGKFPAHWKLRRLKYLLREESTRSASGTEPLLRVSQYTGITKRNQDSGEALQSGRADSLIGYRRVSRGDLVVNIMLAWKGSLGVSPFEGIVSPAYCVYRFGDGMEPWYAHYLLRSATYRARIKALSTGVVESRLRLYTDDLYRLEAISPPPCEQRAIVRFLDHADWRIRRYIRAKERLIELLEEQKQTIIHQAVTGQIDVRTGHPFPAYKDSEVEWMRQVPEHWDVVALRYRYEQCLGKMLDAKRITGEYLIPYLRNVDVQWDEINVVDLPRMDIHPHELRRYTVRPGDLLVCEGGEMGRCAIWEGEIEECGYQKALHRLRPWDGERDEPRFLYYALKVAAMRGAFTDGHESTIAHLTGEKLRAHRLAFPPRDEQEAINAFLDRTDITIRALLTAQRRAIDLLSEYRTRLTADVVTGKVDVRQAATSLAEVDLAAAGDAGDQADSTTAGCGWQPESALPRVHP